VNGTLFFNDWHSLIRTKLVRSGLIKKEQKLNFCEHERCFIAENIYFVQAEFQGRHCVGYRSVQEDYSQVMSISVRSNHIEKYRKHTHGAAGEPNNSCRNLCSDTCHK
jgi:hypothetical protein